MSLGGLNKTESDAAPPSVPGRAPSAPLSSAEVDRSYAFCRRMARRSGSSFYPCFVLLRGAKRRAMDALYAFTRYTDDLGDGPEPLEERRSSLANWRSAVEIALVPGRAGREALREIETARTPLIGRPMLPAIADTVARFAIPAEHLLAVLDGVAMDLDNRCYETFDELAEYCHRVASAVGLACIHVWGFRGEGALEPARKCGLAFQMTNILRDLKEDALQGRVYLPRQDLRDCGCTADDLLAEEASEAFLRLVDREIDRARGLYRDAAELIEWLEPDGKRVLGMMMGVYYGLLEQISRRKRDLLSCRIRLSRWRKLSIAARWLLLPPRRSALPK